MDINQVTLNDILFLVEEADLSDSFLPIKGDEKPVVRNLLQYFNGKEGFNIFALLDSKNNYLGFGTTLPTEEDKSIYLGPLYIINKFQHNGYGQIIEEEIILWCKEQGYKTLYTQTWETNFVSQKLLKKLGFIHYETKENTRVNGESSFCYKMKIN